MHVLFSLCIFPELLWSYKNDSNGQGMTLRELMEEPFTSKSDTSSVRLEDIQLSVANIDEILERQLVLNSTAGYDQAKHLLIRSYWTKRGRVSSPT